jgi:nucleobase:cation symporter-1, NCS1 family
VIAVLTGVYLLLTLPKISFPATGQFSWGAFAAGVALTATIFGLSRVNCAADYSRYLPRDRITGVRVQGVEGEPGGETLDRSSPFGAGLNL